MGITQANVQGGKILEEWTVFDELNILGQLFVPEASNSLAENSDIESEE